MVLTEKGNGWELFWLLMGRIATVMGLAMFVPFVSALVWHEPEAWLFLLPACFSLVLGSGMTRLGAEHTRQLAIREGVLFMALVWPLMGLVGLMPYYISGLLPDFSAAFFLCFFSLTTTGLSCLPFDTLGIPRSLRLWQAIMNWIGGLMFVVVLVTVLPQVSGCFGLTLTARQTIFFSPVWNRMSQSVNQGVSVYALLTVLAAGLFYLAGLPAEESLMRGMVALSSSGGSSVTSFMVHDNGWLELAAGIAMVLSGVNLLLCWKAWNRKSLWLLWQDTELRSFFAILAVAGLAISLHLYALDCYTLPNSLRYGFFQVASFLSTNGFASASFWLWPDFDRYVLFLLVFVGGCIGSAGGGLKVMRILVLFRMTRAEIHRTLHPHMVVSVKVDGLPVPAKIVGRILAFFFLYMMIFMVFSLVLSGTGIDLMQSMGLAAGCLTSAGSTAALVGLGNLHFLPVWAKLSCCLLMILGRVEIFSFLILLDLGARAVRRKW